MSRAFPVRAPELYGSDAAQNRKNKAIFNNIRENIIKKVEQKTGNKAGSVNYCLTSGGGKITGAQDYSTLLGVSKGKALCKPCNASPVFTGLNYQTGNTLMRQINGIPLWDLSGCQLPSPGVPIPSEKGTAGRAGLEPDVIDLASLPDYGVETNDVILDPSHVLFSTGCRGLETEVSLPRWIGGVVLANPGETARADSINFANELNNFNYPAPMCISNENTPKSVMVSGLSGDLQYLNGVYRIYSGNKGPIVGYIWKQRHGPWYITQWAYKQRSTLPNPALGLAGILDDNAGFYGLGLAFFRDGPSTLSSTDIYIEPPTSGSPDIYPKGFKSPGLKVSYFTMFSRWYPNGKPPSTGSRSDLQPQYNPDYVPSGHDTLFKTPAPGPGYHPSNPGLNHPYPTVAAQNVYFRPINPAMR